MRRLLTLGLLALLAGCELSVWIRTPHLLWSHEGPKGWMVCGKYPNRTQCSVVMQGVQAMDERIEASPLAEHWQRGLYRCLPEGVKP